ncbi:hypothetical protein CXQ80_14260 [Pseudomonas sp. 02C 26]|nr:hypothetical protein CXQ80_14260 [Pseudomonas sp. 02C 26]
MCVALTFEPDGIHGSDYFVPLIVDHFVEQLAALGIATHDKLAVFKFAFTCVHFSPALRAVCMTYVFVCDDCRTGCNSFELANNFVKRRFIWWAIYSFFGGMQIRSKLVIVLTKF